MVQSEAVLHQAINKLESPLYTHYICGKNCFRLFIFIFGHKKATKALYIGRIQTRLRVTFAYDFFNLLLVRFHQAEITIVKHLIQGRNKEAWVGAEPSTSRAWPWSTPNHHAILLTSKLRPIKFAPSQFFEQLLCAKLKTGFKNISNPIKSMFETSFKNVVI